MKWAIREQVLVPIVAIQAVATVAFTLTTITLAERRTERQIIERLNGVVDALYRSNFPLTEGILERMRSLSGASFVAYAPDGRPQAASDPTILASAPERDGLGLRVLERFASLSDSPIIELRRVRYYAAMTSTRSPIPGSSLLLLYPEASWREERRELAGASMILGAGALGLMAVSTTWIAHRISIRVLGLTRRVAQIAQGDFRELDAGRQDDEVGALARSINLMCAQLRRMSETIRRSERTQLLAQLGAGLAHQMRNSLTGARMSIQLHARRCPTARDDQSLDVALRQLVLTEEQVRGLLTLGRAEEREHKPGDLAALIAEVRTLLAAACEHARVDFDVGLPKRPALTPIDEASLRSAILNLALNAIEAAGPGGAVRLELFEASDGLVVEVSDTGPGPPGHLATTLFEPLVTGKPEGVGLGLALARHVAEAHHGELTWSREAPWTRFRLTLPRRPGPSPTGAIDGPRADRG